MRTTTISEFFTFPYICCVSYALICWTLCQFFVQCCWCCSTAGISISLPSFLTYTKCESIFIVCVFSSLSDHHRIVCNLCVPLHLSLVWLIHKWNGTNGSVEGVLVLNIYLCQIHTKWIFFKLFILQKDWTNKNRCIQTHLIPIIWQSWWCIKLTQGAVAC